MLNLLALRGIQQMFNLQEFELSHTDFLQNEAT